MKENRFERPEAVRRLGLALGAVALGLAMSAIQYLPVKGYVGWSPRANGMDTYERATSFAWPPEDVFTVYLPQFTGMIDHYWGRNGIKLHSDYLGVVVLMLFGAAFVGMGQDARRRMILFWTGTIAVAILWALGSATPFFQIPYHLIPGTKYFRAPVIFLFVGWIGLALISGIGLERVLARVVKARYLYFWIGFAGLVAVLALSGALTNLASTLERGDMGLAMMNEPRLIAGALRSLAFVGVGAAAILVYLRGQVNLRVAAWLLIGISTVDLWSILREYWQFAPPASQLYASNDAIDYLKKLPQPARVMPFPPSQMRARDADLTHDGLMAHGVRIFSGYHGNEIARYDTLTGGWPQFQQFANTNVRVVTNTQYILAGEDLTGQVGLTKVVGPVRDAAGQEVYLFRLPEEAPYAWVAPIVLKSPDRQAIETLLEPRFDVHTIALFSPDASVQEGKLPDTLPSPLALKVNVDSYAPGRVSMTLSEPAPAGSGLVVSENFYPDWTATIDGKPAKVERADYTFIGLPLPAGARKIDLVFRSSAYETGKLVTLVTGALGIALLLVGAARERRKVA
jgi:hypothetical protein